MKRSTYLLVHMYESFSGVVQHKMIGLYNSRDDAESAILRLINQPGFKDFPEKFIINEYELNKIYDDFEALNFSPT